MKKLLIAITLLLIAWFLTSCYPGVSLAEEPDTFADFLAFLATSGGIGAFIAFFFEKVPYIGDWFATLDKRAKRAVVFVSCFIVPAAALAVSVQLGYNVLTPDLVYKGARAGFEAFGVSQLAHMLAMKG